MAKKVGWADAFLAAAGLEAVDLVGAIVAVVELGWGWLSRVSGTARLTAVAGESGTRRGASVRQERRDLDQLRVLA
jgi:hypothetical protein